MVLAKFFKVLGDGTLWLHTRTTLIEVMIGLALGLSIGTTLGYAIAKNRLLEDLLTPIIVAFQSTPIVAYAPLLIIWFGSGMESKIITSTLIVFFPMLMNTVVGIRNVPADLRDLMRVSQASPWQTFQYLELPAAMPVLLTGLKTSATLAVIGAVVGEFIVANAGLGFWINLARQQYDTPLVYVAVMTLALMAGSLYVAVTYMERRLLAWQRNNNGG
jgi:NitT/TauT family transport system permease protein